VPEVQLPFPFPYPLSRKRFTQKPRLLDGILRIKHLKLGSKNEKKIVFKSSKFLKKLSIYLAQIFMLTLFLYPDNTF